MLEPSSESAAARRSTTCSPTSRAWSTRPRRASGSSPSRSPSRACPRGRARGAPDRPADGARGDAARRRRAGRRLYHGIYARMYSLFLFTATLSLLLLLRALERGTVGRWAAWAAATLALLATQPYGVLVLAAEVVYVAVLRARGRCRSAARWSRSGPCSCSRCRSGGRTRCSRPASRSALGEASSELGSPLDVVEYLWDVFGDFTAGWLAASDPAPLARGRSAWSLLARTRPETAAPRRRSWPACPPLALLAAGSGPGVSLETRHLIFLLPFATMAIAAGLLRLGAALGRRGPGRRRAGARSGSSSRRRSPGGSTGPAGSTPASRRRAPRRAAKPPTGSRRTGRDDDVLFGYEPTYLDAWEQGAPVRRVFVPRADASSRSRRSRTRASRSAAGSGCSTPPTTSIRPGARADDPERHARAGFETAAFGPFLLVRTRRARPDAARVPRGDARGAGAEARARDRRRRAQRCSRPRRRSTSCGG